MPKVSTSVPSTFSSITIGIASTEEIIRKSSGEITNARTISYKDYNPEIGGLFCERIFGPVKSFKCLCNTSTGFYSKGSICPNCGTEIIDSSVRRYRYGHIQLVSPVVNPCFFKQNPNRIAILLDLQYAQLEKIVYCELYVVLQPGPTEKIEEDNLKLKKYQLLTIEKYNWYIQYIEELEENNVIFDEKFVAKTGADAILDMLHDLKINDIYFDLKEKISTAKQTDRDFYLKKLHVVKDFVNYDNNSVVNKPEYMIMKVVPVIPPALRPLNVIEGNIVTSDFNALYRKIIIRNQRLKRLIENNSLDILIRFEKRLLQEAVNDLFIGSVTKNNSNDTTKKYKSLTETIKGKEGRFRQNLLGKRVDYSGRSVIVINPNLKINECGVPKDMALEMFTPFVISKLLDRQIADTVVDAEEKIKLKNPVVYEILENILVGYPVLLNRAPTLHKMSIQAFQPILVEGNAIQLNPLVCTQFNADFDGDQLGIHIPLSIRAREESILLMLSSNNLFKSSDSEPSFIPNMDAILGIYYLTMQVDDERYNDVKFVSSSEEVTYMIENKHFSIYTKVKIKIDNYKDTVDDYGFVSTTAGRVLFNTFLPDNFPFVNDAITSSKIKEIISNISKNYPSSVAINFIDKIKELGFMYAYKSGISFKINDLKVPDEKKKIIENVEKKIETINESYMMGLVEEKEKYNQIIALWMKVVNIEMMAATMKNLNNDKDKFNSISLMLSSGARGSKSQILQMCGMRGLMTKSQKSSSSSSPSIIETPIISSFKEGLSVLEYFISTYGGRKGMTDTSLKTAQAGYLSRKLVDVAQNVVIQEYDCHTKMSIPIYKYDKFSKTFYDNKTFKKMLFGRVVAEDVINVLTGETIVKVNGIINDSIADKIIEVGITCVRIRSVFTCKCKTGICALCYGISLGFYTIAKKGEPVGTIAAQSIGAVATQLTLNTFHFGGVVSSTIFDGVKKANFGGIIKIVDLEFVEKDGKKIVISNSSEIYIIHSVTNFVQEIFQIQYSSVLYVNDGSIVKSGDILFEYNPYYSSIIAHEDGIIEYKDFDNNIVIQEDENNKSKNICDKYVTKINNNNIAYIALHTKNKTFKYRIYEKYRILVNDGEKIKAGTVIIKSPRNLNVSSDITGGLPRIVDLFEARSVKKKKAFLSDISGVVKFGDVIKNKIEVIVQSKSCNITCKYLIPIENDLLVQEGDSVKCGTPLCKGDMDPNEILKTNGFLDTCLFLLKEIKNVYGLQGIYIIDKHLEIIIKKMFSFVKIVDSGDTNLIEGDIVYLNDFMNENKKHYNKNVIVNSGDSLNYKKRMLISDVDLSYENSILESKGLKKIEVRKCVCAKAKLILCGISQVSLNSSSFLSSASFQYTIDVLTAAAAARKTDVLSGIKENVVVGHVIPAGTGFKDFKNIDVEYIGNNNR